MESSRYKYGLTLIEMLVVVAVIVLLAGLTIGIGSHLDTQSKERAVKSTFAVLEAALEQFYDYKYRYADPNYERFRFPPDCSEFPLVSPNPLAGLEPTLSILEGAAVQITNHDQTFDPKYLEYSGCEVLYFFLSKVPECRETLERIDGSLVTNTNEDGGRVEISVGGRPAWPFLRVVDPWGTTLRYDYYDERVLDLVLRYQGRKTFPVITSAGPDKVFNTPDDISSR